MGSQHSVVRFNFELVMQVDVFTIPNHIKANYKLLSNPVSKTGRRCILSGIDITNWNVADRAPYEFYICRVHREAKNALTKT